MIIFRAKNGKTTTNIDEAQNFSRLSDELYVENHPVDDTKIVLEQRLTFADGLLLGIVAATVICMLLWFMFH